MTSRPLASPGVDVQSLGARPQRPCSAGGMLTVAAGAGWVDAAGAFAGGAPEASGTESLIVGSPAVFLALSSTGSRPLHDTTATMKAQEISGGNARSMKLQRCRAPDVSFSFSYRLADRRDIKFMFAVRT